MNEVLEFAERAAVKRIARLVGAYLAGVCLALGTAVAAAPAAEGELVFGVYPYLSPRQMAEQFHPLKEFLSGRLGRRIVLRSAPDFKRFIDRTRAGEYDLIFDAPHMARVAQTRDGYQPLAQTGYKIAIVVIVRKDSVVQSLTDLRGKSLAIGARLSMTHQIVAQELQKLGLILERDIKYVDAASFSNVLQSVLRGEADAGATGTLLWDNATDIEKSSLREVFRQKESVPGFIVAAHPRLGGEALKTLQAALFAFKSSPQGKEYFLKTHQGDFRPVEDATLRSLDPYTGIILQP
jgi:phosphonate transport system substrate-binding protein